MGSFFRTKTQVLEPRESHTGVQNHACGWRPGHCTASPSSPLLGPELQSLQGRHAQLLEGPQVRDLVKLFSPTVRSRHTSQVPIGVYGEHLGPLAGWARTQILHGDPFPASPERALWGLQGREQSWSCLQSHSSKELLRACRGARIPNCPPGGLQLWRQHCPTVQGLDLEEHYLGLQPALDSYLIISVSYFHPHADMIIIPSPMKWGSTYKLL